MKMQDNSPQRPESRHFARHLLWIPAVGVLLAASYLTMHSPPVPKFATMAVATPTEVASIARFASSEASSGPVNLAPSAADAAIIEHQLLDTVGVGLNVPR